MGRLTYDAKYKKHRQLQGQEELCPEAPPIAALLCSYHVNWMRSGWRECGTGSLIWTYLLLLLNCSSVWVWVMCWIVNPGHSVWAIRHIFTNKSNQKPLWVSTTLQGFKQLWSSLWEPQRQHERGFIFFFCSVLFVGLVFFVCFCLSQGTLFYFFLSVKHCREFWHKL